MLLRNALLCTVLLPCLLQAQDLNPNAGKKYQVGINSTNFVKKIISTNNGVVNQRDPDNPYLLTFKYFKKDKRAYRIGLNYNYTFFTADGTGGGSSSTLNSHEADLRLGYEWNKFISPRWQWYYGVDALIDYTNNKSVQRSTVFGGGIRTTTIADDVSHVGVSPLAGLQFHIAKRISLSTETSLRCLFGKTYTSNTRDPGNVKNSNWSTASNIKMVMPSSLFLLFYF